MRTRNPWRRSLGPAIPHQCLPWRRCGVRAGLDAYEPIALALRVCKFRPVEVVMGCGLRVASSDAVGLDVQTNLKESWLTPRGSGLDLTPYSLWSEWLSYEVKVGVGQNHKARTDSLQTGHTGIRLVQLILHHSLGRCWARRQHQLPCPRTLMD